MLKKDLATFFGMKSSVLANYYTFGMLFTFGMVEWKVLYLEVNSLEQPINGTATSAKK